MTSSSGVPLRRRPSASMVSPSAANELSSCGADTHVRPGFVPNYAKSHEMKFAKIVFWVASIWGILVLTPLYFMSDLIGRQDPPPITHPAFYYGFVTVALAWQIAFM